MNEKSKEIITQSKRIVVKIGSSLLIDQKDGKLKQKWLQKLAANLSELIKDGKEIVIVSSGAIGLGREVAGFAKGKLKLEQSQASAAIGQIALAKAYEAAFHPFDLQVAQILLSLEDSENRKRYLNATNTINTLIAHQFIPVINENDTIATSEIRFGDNDRLAARVASMINADLLILLSDIDGLYDANPQKDENANHIPIIQEITSEIEQGAGTSGSDYGTGGMITKILAAKIATESACHMIICDGRIERPIEHILKDGKSSLFFAQDTKVSAKKKWLNATLDPKGSLYVDQGAERALMNGKSLLSAGVYKISGKFDNGDTLAILNDKEEIIAHGLSNYQSKDAELIIGKKSSEIDAILGYAGRANIVHRDHLVLSKSIKEQ